MPLPWCSPTKQAKLSIKNKWDSETYKNKCWKSYKSTSQAVSSSLGRAFQNRRRGVWTSSVKWNICHCCLQPVLNYKTVVEALTYCKTNGRVINCAVLLVLSFTDAKLILAWWYLTSAYVLEVPSYLSTLCFMHQLFCFFLYTTYLSIHTLLNLCLTLFSHHCYYCYNAVIHYIIEKLIR